MHYNHTVKADTAAVPIRDNLALAGKAKSSS